MIFNEDPGHAGARRVSCHPRQILSRPAFAHGIDTPKTDSCMHVADAQNFSTRPTNTGCTLPLPPSFAHECKLRP